MITVIHGLAAKPAEPILRYGCESALGQECRLVYWADLMGYKPISDFDGARKYSLGEHLILPIKAGLRWYLKEAFEIGLTGKDGRGRIRKGLHDWLIGWTNRTSLATYHQFLPDMSRYLEQPATRAEILTRLTKQIDPETTLIAHSMGSIIALDLLKTGKHRIKKLITIGSPVGLSLVQEQLEIECWAAKEMIRLSCGSWINIADPLDIVALDSEISDEYPGVTDLRVWNEQIDINGHRHHHSLYGYLRSKVLQEQL